MKIEYNRTIIDNSRNKSIISLQDEDQLKNTDTSKLTEEEKQELLTQIENSLNQLSNPNVEINVLKEQANNLAITAAISLKKTKIGTLNITSITTQNSEIINNKIGLNIKPLVKEITAKGSAEAHNQKALVKEISIKGGAETYNQTPLEAKTVKFSANDAKLMTDEGVLLNNNQDGNTEVDAELLKNGTVSSPSASSMTTSTNEIVTGVKSAYFGTVNVSLINPTNFFNLLSMYKVLSYKNVYGVEIQRNKITKFLRLDHHDSY